jgi:uncharacterized protein YaaR (DUF327 family)
MKMNPQDFKEESEPFFQRLIDNTKSVWKLENLKEEIENDFVLIRLELFGKLFNYSKSSEEYIKRIETLLDTIKESKNQAINEKFFEKLTSFKIHKEELLSFLIERLDKIDDDEGFKSLSTAQFNTLQ